MIPTERILSALTEHDCDPKQNGAGWSARCPAHDDRRPSLSIAEGDDGRALVDCKAGCPTETVVAAVSMTMRDLFPDDTSTSTEPRQTRDKRQLCRRRQSNGKAAATYPTAKAAIEALERKLGKRSALWTYRDANSDPVGVIVRWDKGGGKEIRPVTRRGDRWIIGGMPEPRPLYGLPDLVEAERVYICEGEKAADAARAIGLTATTSAHGSQSPDKTDWSPLAGKECVILPDNDEAGERYAEDVTAILATLTPVAVIKVVELRDLPDHGDIADWIDQRDAHESEELRAEIKRLADVAEPIQSERPKAPIHQYQPFPTESLTELVRRFVRDGAKAIGCDESFIALPLLTVLATAIGTTRRIQLKRGWTAPAIIWAAIVGDSGTSKSPAFKLAMRPLNERQGKAIERCIEEAKSYETDLAHYGKALGLWKQDKKTNDPAPEKPIEPQAERCVVSDVTVESLAPLLQANPRGLLMARDELAGWLGSFDRYAGGKGGSDAANWLSIHSGERIVVDRKTGPPRTIYVPEASVSVAGGIQPGILRRQLGVEHRESGLAARLLVAWPPRKAKRWTEADIDPATEKRIADLVNRLYDLEPMIDDEGDRSPVVIGLTPGAKEIWKDFFNSHNREQADLTGEMAAVWSKLEEYAPRLALVIHYARWAADDPGLHTSGAVDAASMEAGITLAQWFKGEARRVYSMLSESDDGRDQRRLVEWIERKGGSVTAREVQQGHREYETAPDAEAALNELAKAGHGHWESTPAGQRGQPTRRFVLSTVSTVYGNAMKPDENGNTVDVDSVDDPETPSDDEWGEL